jgi:two-component system, NarL family, invasion response regulator UvrY
LPVHIDDQSVMHRSRVLLVDDNREFIETAERLLDGTYEIVGKAQNGEDGLKAALTLLPDIIVLDISMPDINGFEVVSRLRQRKNRAGIVLLTVHEDIDFVRAAHALGVLGYVTKRRIATDLPTAVREVLEGRAFSSPPLDAAGD